MKLTQQTLILLVLCCAWCGCSGSYVDSAKLTDTSAKPAAPQAGELDSTALPQLPAPGTLAGGGGPSRQSSAAGDSVFIAGEDYSESLPNQNTSTFNGAVFLDSGQNGGWITTKDFADLGYAIFEFNLSELSPAPRVRADWIVGSYDQQVYVALANFDLDRWSWFQPAGGSSFEVPSLDLFTDDDGRVLVLVMNAGTQYLQLAGVSIGSLWDSNNVAQFGEFEQIQDSDMELASIGGLPALAYVEEEGDEEYYVRFTRALDDAGTEWTEPVDLLGPGERSYDISLLEVNGRPALAYRESSFSLEIEQDVSSLYYMRAEDAEGSSWGAPVLVDAGGDGQHGQSPFLAIVNGRPAMSYKNEDSESFSEGLMYVRAADADGSAWGEAVVAAPPVSFGYGLYDAPLAVINGKPAIAYQYSSPFELGYVRALDENGDEWGFGNTIFTDTPAGYHLFLQDIGGLPALVYDSDNSSQTNFIKGIDADGIEWGSEVLINESGEGDPGSQPMGVAVIDGMPAVLVKQWAANRIVLCRAVDEAGSSWGAPEHVTYTLEFSSNSKLLQISSRPGFVSVTGGQLVYSQYD